MSESECKRDGCYAIECHPHYRGYCSNYCRDVTEAHEEGWKAGRLEEMERSTAYFDFVVDNISEGAAGEIVAAQRKYRKHQKDRLAAESKK